MDFCITFAALKTTIYAPIGWRFQIFTGERISKKKVKWAFPISAFQEKTIKFSNYKLVSDDFLEKTSHNMRYLVDFLAIRH